MNRLNRKIEYALMSLKVIASSRPTRPSPAKTTVKEICELVGTPFDATARVMQIMAQKGLLKSEQGVNGGYILAKDLSEVSLHQLITWILGPSEITRCLHKDHACELVEGCNIVSPMRALNQRITDFYANIPLSEVIHAG